MNFTHFLAPYIILLSSRIGLIFNTLFLPKELNVTPIFQLKPICWEFNEAKLFKTKTKSFLSALAKVYIEFVGDAQPLISLISSISNQWCNNKGILNNYILSLNSPILIFCQVGWEDVDTMIYWMGIHTIMSSSAILSNSSSPPGHTQQLSGVWI